LIKKNHIKQFYILLLVFENETLEIKLSSVTYSFDVINLTLKTAVLFHDLSTVVVYL